MKNIKNKYSLTWYSVEDGSLLGEENMSKLTARQVQKMFYLSNEEPAIFCYSVRASQRVIIEKLVKHEIDLNNFDYFVECHSE